MLDLSLAGLIGAFLGTAVAAFAYPALVPAVEHFVRAGAQSQSTDESASASNHETLQQELALLRRGVLAADIIVCAGLGYWLAATLAG